jgi:hypothetical protein
MVTAMNLADSPKLRIPWPARNIPKDLPIEPQLSLFIRFSLDTGSYLNGIQKYEVYASITAVTGHSARQALFRPDAALADTC